MKKMLLCLLCALTLPLTAQQLTADEIVRRADENQRGKSSYSEITMTIVRPTWQRKLSFKSWGLGSAYAMTVITAPAKEKGQGFLKRQNDLWNWQPTIERMIKMSSSVMGQSWMGSDFTNDDLMRESSIVEDYTHSLDGEESIRDAACYKLTLIPKEDASVVWGKVVMWVTKADFVNVKSEFYDEDGVLIHTIDGYDIQSYGKHRLPSRIEVVPADKPKQKTVMTTQKYEFDISIQESFFSQQRMKQPL